ncbi:MAG: EF-hand domain-containing protein [Planctomycetota bacterium]|nr:EF-hand domain-containing protein [Planctomycetota bacterium]MDW8372988.1 EF-hand domain-containing protein [Planctomycetota bacterium]
MRHLRIIPILLPLMAVTAEKPPQTSANPGEQATPRPIIRLFDMADSDHDGSVTRNEMRQALEKRHQEQRERRFQQLDRNHDGVISREEFLQAPPPRNDREKPRHPFHALTIDEIFERFDRNQDGVLTRDEIPCKPPKKRACERSRGPCLGGNNAPGGDG